MHQRAVRPAQPSKFREIVRETESCWYLNSRTIVAGSAKKRNGIPCGACIPCLIRKVALGRDEVETGVDFTKRGDEIAKDPVVRVHFDAYAAFANRVLSDEYSTWDLMDDIPQVTRDALDRNLTLEDVLDVYRRFAREWRACFPEKRA